MTEFTCGQAYQALVDCQGNVTKAAQALDVKRVLLQNMINKSPELQVLLNDFREEAKDIAEENIFSDVKRGDQSASRFVLQTIGRDRGYVTGVAGSGKDGAITIEIVKFSEEAKPNGE